MKALEEILVFIENAVTLALRESHTLYPIALMTIGEEEGAFRAMAELARKHSAFDARQPRSLHAYLAMQVAAEWCALRPIQTDLGSVWIVSPFQADQSVVHVSHPMVMAHGMDIAGKQLLATYWVKGQSLDLASKSSTADRLTQHPLRVFWKTYNVRRVRWN